MTRRQWLASQLFISWIGLACGEYLGCYKDTEEMLMKGYLQNFIFSLTPDRCTDVCTNKGFQYAGLKARIRCLCDQHPPPQSTRSEESLCQGSCVGDSTKICGGNDTLSVYSTRLLQKAGVVEGGTREPLKDIYIGCYKDNTNARLLSGYFQTLPKNSPKKCNALCYQKGFLYSGMEYGMQCFCGDAHPPPALRREPWQCSMPCPGDSEHQCGGNARLSVYETGITDIPVLAMKLGCFHDEDPRVLDGYKVDLDMTNSPRRCTNLCRSLGYLYSGMEYGMECFCGNTINANNTRDSADDECNTTCPGDVFYSCGANWNLMLYKTGLSDPEPVIKKVGCFTSNSSLILKGYRQDFIETTTPEKCAKLCYNKGFLYSSLISRLECWCDSKKLVQSLSVRNEKCEEKNAVIYETGYIVPQPGQKDHYVGCFNDDKNSGALDGFYQKFESYLTPEKCSQLCFSKGYLYSGTKNKNECHCGDRQLKESDNKVDNEGCYSPCSGDASKHCGGEGKLYVYATGITDFPSTGKLIGCFVDESIPRVLDEHKTDLDKTNSPRRCLNYCLQLGFMYAGVQYKKECFCGNRRPTASLSTQDSECDSACSGDSSQMCGGGWRMSIYGTDYKTTIDPVNPVPVVTPKPDNKCEQSETLVNGKSVCRGAVVFLDTFTTSSLASHWHHVVKIPDAPDYEFVTFTSDPVNSFQRDGKLVIKPTLIPDNEVQDGAITLEGCTGLAATRECEMMALSYNILPPVRSARIHTDKSFSFRYGTVTIRARLPAGDWLVPELWLLPKGQSYGSNYLSGKVQVALSRGNRYLSHNGGDIGSSTLESGILAGPEHNVTGRSVINRIADSWNAHTHNYTLVWTPDNLSFYVDGQSQQALLPPGVRLAELLGFNKTTLSAWTTGSRIAPFDTDFYLSLGVSAGGSRYFPDGCISKNKEKPWSNFKLKAMLNFWLNKDSWRPSWDDNKSSLIVELVQVTAL